jgi:hypothetical protein
MDPRTTPGRAVRPQQTPQQVTNTSVSRSNYPAPRRKKWGLIGAVLLIALLVLGALAWHKLNPASSPRGDRYQAVFLDNGQVFFGKLKNTSGQYLRLEGAYYSKAQDVPEDATAEQKATVANNVSLAKVGNEVYGPESTVQIRAEQVLFWQDLRSDSKVTKAIDSAK